MSTRLPTATPLPAESLVLSLLGGVLGTAVGAAILGAAPSLLLMVNAARAIATGVVIGLALSAVFARLIEKMLFGVRPLDPATFALVAIVVAVTASLAIAGPA